MLEFKERDYHECKPAFKGLEKALRSRGFEIYDINDLDEEDKVQYKVSGDEVLIFNGETDFIKYSNINEFFIDFVCGKPFRFREGFLAINPIIPLMLYMGLHCKKD